MKLIVPNKISNFNLKQKLNGVWLSGIEYEGEFIKWYSAEQIQEHSFWKNGEKHGEYKKYKSNGQLLVHCFYKDGKLEGEFKMWELITSELWEHCFYKEGELHGEYKRNYNSKTKKWIEHYYYKNGKVKKITKNADIL